MIDKDLFQKNEANGENEKELYEHYRFIVDPKQSSLRIDKFLSFKLPNVSRNKIQIAARVGNIKVNSKSVKPNYKVKPNDVISVLLSFPPRDAEIIPENIPIDIIYEDNDIIVINKKAGMVVHPAYANYTGTLVNAVAWHLKDSKIDNNGWGAFLIHRIDKDTSGLIVLAKTEIAQAILARQFFEHTIEREYLALVWGNLNDNEGTIKGNLGRSHKDRRVMAVCEENRGKHAITHYKVLERFGYVTLLACKLETGRTHQIRAHMAYIGHPLFNDVTYGGNKILKGTISSKYKQFIENCFTVLPRQALHARILGFLHPTTANYMTFEAPLPDDMLTVIEKWQRYVSGHPLINY